VSLRDAIKSEPDGVAAVFRVADALGLERRELAHVINLESGWNPLSRNSIDARGLLQWTPRTRRNMKLDPLPDTIKGQAQTIELFFRSLGRIPPGDVYVATAAPALLGKPDATIAYAVGSPEWKANPSLRGPSNGDITAGSIRRAGTPPSSLTLPTLAELDRMQPAPGAARGGFGILLLLVALAWDSKRR